MEILTNKEGWIDALEEFVLILFESKIALLSTFAVIALIGAMFVVVAIMGYSRTVKVIIPKDIRIFYHLTFFIFLPLVSYHGSIWVPQVQTEIPAYIFYAAFWVGLGLVVFPILALESSWKTWRDERRIPSEFWLLTLLVGMAYGIGRFSYWLFF